MSIGLAKSRSQMARAFFDRKRVKNAMDKATLRALRKGGAQVRLVARRSIRWRKSTSAPGSPPHSQTGILRESIYFAWDGRKRSVVIGPARLNKPAPAGPARTTAELLEKGGRVRRKRRRKRRVLHYRARPYMGPALEKVKDKLPSKWANSVR
jgi:hypothetical protein